MKQPVDGRGKAVATVDPTGPTPELLTMPSETLHFNLHFIRTGHLGLSSEFGGRVLGDGG